jgi:hypothetical protein
MFTDASRILIDYQYLCARCCWQPNPSCILQQCILCVPSFCRAAGKESGESLLGKVTIEEYTTHQGLLHGDLAKRAKHFFTESARVCAGT